MDTEQLRVILNSHLKWIRVTDDGIRANLSEADLTGVILRGVDLSGANLRKADLSGADLSEANLQQADLTGAILRRASLSRVNLSKANLSGAILSRVNLSRAILRGANLSGAILYGAILSGANLSEANLSGADLTGAILGRASLRRVILSGVNLSGAKGLLNPTAWLRENFKTTDEGLIVHKALGDTYRSAPAHWTIAPGEYLEEIVNPDRGTDCGCGMNFATPEWIHAFYGDKIQAGTVQIWECLIEWLDLASVVVPFNTDGKARCGRIKLLRIIDW